MRARLDHRDPEVDVAAADRAGREGEEGVDRGARVRRVDLELRGRPGLAAGRGDLDGTVADMYSALKREAIGLFGEDVVRDAESEPSSPQEC